MPHALILVGGFGTRLRPLTLDFPKPLVPFANEEMIFHQIRALYNVGVRVVVLAVASPSTPGQPHQKKHLEEPIRKWHAELPGLEIKINEEEIPLGTAGPIKLGKHLLFENNKDNLAFVLNSDVTCRYPFAQMLEQHAANKALGTILVTPVKDPSRFGVVQFENQEEEAAIGGKVLGFFEKPQEYKGNCINAGVYLLDLTIIDKYIKGDEKTPCSIERQVFPEMQKDGVLYALQLPKDNYWADIGQPEDYITGLGMHLQDMGRSAPEKLAKQDDAKAGEYTLVGNCLIDPSAKIGKKCTIGPNVTIGANCVIGDATKLSNCAVFSNVKIGMATRIKDSIVSNYCQIGNYCHFENVTVLGQCIVVNDDVHLSNIRGINSFTIKNSAENSWLAY